MIPYDILRPSLGKGSDTKERQALRQAARPTSEATDARPGADLLCEDEYNLTRWSLSPWSNSERRECGGRDAHRQANLPMASAPDLDVLSAYAARSAKPSQPTTSSRPSPETAS